MPTYCTLNDAYGSDWNKKSEKKVESKVEPPKDPICPNCNSCLSQNNKFQQQVVNTAIRPLPRWVPQGDTVMPGSLDPPKLGSFGPYDRNYEYFGQENCVENGESMIELVLYLLIGLFVLQIIEFIV